MFRSLRELFNNEYGRKVIAYIVAPRDSRFFLKDYVKRLEKGDSSETRKKDPEKRQAEIFDYSKPFLIEFVAKEMHQLLYNGGVGILIPFILQKLGKEAKDLIQKCADIILEKSYEERQTEDKVS